MNTSVSDHRACVVCPGNTVVHKFCTLDRLWYVRCARCGLVFVDRLAQDVSMRAAYTGGWTKAMRRRLMAPFRKLKHHRHFDLAMERARRIFDFSAASFPERTGLRFLDIGCNRGFLLTAALEQDAEVYGIELVREIMLPFCNTYPHLRDRIYSNKLSAVGAEFADGFFDLITAIDVVEHFEDPLADMRQIHRMLRPGGVLVIQTPDAGCVQARRTGCDWGALKPLEHLHLFDRHNFATFASRAGFHAIEVGEPFEEADGNFVAVLRK